MDSRGTVTRFVNVRLLIAFRIGRHYLVEVPTEVEFILRPDAL